MKKNKVGLCSLLILAIGCSDPARPPVGPGDQVPLDSLAVIVAPGVIERIDGFKNSYTLDDTVTWSLRLINFDNWFPFRVFSGAEPPWNWSVSYVASDSVVAFQPEVLAPSFWTRDLALGDTINFDLRWDLNTPYPLGRAFHLGHLRAFSGIYRLKATLGTNTKVLTKYIAVTQIGDPLSSLAYSRSSGDSLLIDLVVRNRVTDAQEHQFDHPYPITVFFTNSTNQQDTLLSLRCAVSFSSLALPGHRDTVLFSFRAARTDSMFAQFHGGYHVGMIMRMRDREILAASTWVWFPLNANASAKSSAP